MPYGHTRMKWKKRKILLDSYFTSNCWKTWQQKLCTGRVTLKLHLPSAVSFLTAPLTKDLQSDKPTNGYPHDWNFALTDKRGEGFIFFLYLKNHVFNHTDSCFIYSGLLTSNQVTIGESYLFILTTLTIITPISHSNLQPLLCFSYFQRLF